MKNFLVNHKILVISAALLSCALIVLIYSISYYFKTKNCEESNSVFSSEPNIVIDVSGAIKSPGLYSLPYGSRVGEAVDKAGGFIETVDSVWLSRNINLSQKLEDEDKIYIPFEWEYSYSSPAEILPLLSSPLIRSNNKISNSNSGNSSTPISQPKSSVVESGSSGQELSDLVHINDASLSELDSLPGIGPAYAQKIVSSRPYADFATLAEKSGVPKATLDKIQKLISFN